MAIVLDPTSAQILSYLGGGEFPQADEDKARSAGDA